MMTDKTKGSDRIAQWELYNDGASCHDDGTGTTIATLYNRQLS